MLLNSKSYSRVRYTVRQHTVRVNIEGLPRDSRLNSRAGLRNDRVAEGMRVLLARMRLPLQLTGFIVERVLALIDETTVTVIELDTGEILSEHHIDPTRGYWRDHRQKTGRWPDSHQ